MDKMIGSLEARMHELFSAFAGSESVDRLFPSGTHEGLQRGDYLLENRRVIVEFKNLCEDQTGKVNAEVAKHIDRDDFPVFYRAELHQLLKQVPDGDAINRSIYEKVTRLVEKAVRSAEDQIVDTNKILSLNGSVSLLVLLNESITVPSPTVIAHRVHSLMHRKRTGRSDSPVLDFVWLVSESHVATLTPQVQGFLSILVEGPRAPEFSGFHALFRQLNEAWAALNGTVSWTAPENLSSNVPIEPVKQVTGSGPAKIRRQELWEREYDANPYLRESSDQEVLRYGACVLKELAPNFLTGGSAATTPETLHKLMRAATCFFREASHRALDLRNVPNG